jgi:hypothetical protein
MPLKEGVMSGFAPRSYWVLGECPEYEESESEKGMVIASLVGEISLRSVKLSDSCQLVSGTYLVSCETGTHASPKQMVCAPVK